MLKFKNVGVDVHVGQRLELGSPLVEHGAALDVDGTLSGETDDAYLVDVDGDVRAWPKAQWDLVKPARSGKSE